MKFELRFKLNDKICEYTELHNECKTKAVFLLHKVTLPAELCWDPVVVYTFVNLHLSCFAFTSANVPLDVQLVVKVL